MTGPKSIELEFTVVISLYAEAGCRLPLLLSHDPECDAGSCDGQPALGVDHMSRHSVSLGSTPKLDIYVVGFAALLQIDNGGFRLIARIGIKRALITAATAKNSFTRVGPYADLVTSGRQSVDSIDAPIVRLEHLVVG